MFKLRSLLKLRRKQTCRALRPCLFIGFAVLAFHTLRRSTRPEPYETDLVQRRAKITCECSNPGSMQRGQNGFWCSDSLYDGFCRPGTACLAPVGHAWDLGEGQKSRTTSPPCGPRKIVEEFNKFKVYSQVSSTSACARTMLVANPSDAHLCADYEDLKLIVPNCSQRKAVVPRVCHSVGRSAEPTQLQRIVESSNPLFTYKRHSDESAFRYIEEKCGEEVARAYSCLRSAAFRADVFRFCALYAEGGVYLDEDVITFRPLFEIVSECSASTIGHDFPAGGQPAKQMKILAATPGAPLMECALRTILQNVRDRAYPESPLGLSGPLMLERCFRQFPDDVAISYIDTHHALWPFSGMRAGNAVLAYEYPTPTSRHWCVEDCDSTSDYARDFETKRVYFESCSLS